MLVCMYVCVCKCFTHSVHMHIQARRQSQVPSIGTPLTFCKAGLHLPSDQSENTKWPVSLGGPWVSTCNSGVTNGHHYNSFTRGFWGSNSGSVLTEQVVH